ncbi:hypothetical protein [Paenibacillus larvae]|uniref:hypothetical protein n=1 Tax=Paenibacillus larvae TaxID=1464 RepID=UPI0028905AD2|nr:hypothetical protein [Paenibacillus larvae]MDT2194548.1 hypothetical protein [Paenibacillus larvae]MDT2264381.1 hypothetical protein [Paenibacillus larvae]MDT2276427.1 hypothetical protein [Paenibacillus larvae]
MMLFKAKQAAQNEFDDALSKKELQLNNFKKSEFYPSAANKPPCCRMYGSEWGIWSTRVIQWVFFAAKQK